MSKAFTSKRTMSIIGAALIVVLAAGALEAAAPYYFYPVTPCRAVNTQTGNGGVVSFGAVRTFTMKNVCGVPNDAAAVSLNATVTQQTAGGWVGLYPSGTAYSGISTVNFQWFTSSGAVANGAIVPLGPGATDDLSVTSKVTPVAQTYHLIIDVTGYYK